MGDEYGDYAHTMQSLGACGYDALSALQLSALPGSYFTLGCFGFGIIPGGAWGTMWHGMDPGPPVYQQSLPSSPLSSLFFSFSVSVLLIKELYRL